MSNADLERINAELAQLKAQETSVKARSEAKSALPYWWSTTDAMTISSAVLVFGVLIFVLATWLVHKGSTPESVLRIFGTILIIIAGLFLVVAGYDSQQIAPVMGLLGTIAGYLLGKSEEKTRRKDGDAPSNESARG